MRFPFISVALLVLAHSVVPGVHGAPAIFPGRAALLEVRQSTIPDTLLGLITSIVGKVLGTIGLAEANLPLPPPIANQVAQLIAQRLQETPNVIDPRGLLDSSSATSSTPSTTTTGQTGASTSASSSSSPASSIPQRMHRQLPISPPVLPSSAASSATPPSASIKPTPSRSIPSPSASQTS